MFAQLGNIVFDGFFSFNSFSSEGNEAKLAEFELLNAKPRIQKTGDTLEQISVTINVHAKERNPSAFIDLLRSLKASGEVLPLLIGNGRYAGDYIIESVPYQVTSAFADGSIIEASITLNLKEYLSTNKIELAQQEAKRKAFAVGDKSPVINRTPQPPTEIYTVGKGISEVTQQTYKIDQLVSEYENNVAAREVTAKRIKDTCDTVNAKISEVNSKLDEAREIQNKFTGIKSVALTVATAVTAIKDMMPPNSIADLRDSNTYLQQVSRVFSRTTTPLIQDVILRR